MVKVTRKILVTSALPYVNNIPHLGNLVCVISADVYTRFLRSKGENVLSVLGTDENGTTVEVKAKELGITPQETVDKFFKHHKNIYEWFGCDFDCFGRSSSKENAEISSAIFKKLHENGFIVEKEIEQLYAEKDDMFLADRFVTGTCPHCSFEQARGDQCDGCGKLLNATELINPKSVISGETPIIKKTTHLFIDLPALEPELKTWMHSVEKHWSNNAKTTTQGWLKEGLKPRAITRDIKWGIPVPLEAYKNKVFYSWFDAPIGYISIIKESGKDWKEWWQDKNTEVVQFMGKDNIPFHTILFPAFLLGTKDPYTLVKYLSVNEYLNYEDGKFSKSRNVGFFCDDAMNLGVPADVWRFYTIRNRPESTDYTFSWQDFGERINKELVAAIGNLVNRTLPFLERNYAGKLPELKNKLDYQKELDSITNHYEKIELKQALEAILHLAKKGNQYFQEQEPWKAIKEDTSKADNALSNLAHIIKDLAIVLEPIMPDTAKKIFDFLNISPLKWDDLGKQSLQKDHQLNKPELLFKKLEEDQLKKWKEQFAGKKQEALDLRVAKIIKVEDHPDAEKLYVIQLDLGSEQRQIVSGLKDYYKKEELENKHIILVYNLEPAKLRGVESNGMLLAVDDGKNCEVLFAEKSKPGDPVFSKKKEKGSKVIPYKTFKTFILKAKQGTILKDDVPLKTDAEPISAKKMLDGDVC